MIALVAAICPMAGQAAGNQAFDSEGLSFSYPSDWEITDQEDYEGVAYYLAVEKKGDDASGLVVISWMSATENVTRESTMQANLESLREDTVLGELEFTEVPDASYAGHKALCTSYAVTVGGIPHSGRIYVLEHSGTVVSIIAQEADEDNRVNKNGFDLIESTFKLSGIK